MVDTAVFGEEGVLDASGRFLHRLSSCSASGFVGLSQTQILLTLRH